jgi:hypothetical protein
VSFSLSLPFPFFLSLPLPLAMVFLPSLSEEVTVQASAQVKGNVTYFFLSRRLRLIDLTLFAIWTSTRWPWALPLSAFKFSALKGFCGASGWVGGSSVALLGGTVEVPCPPPVWLGAPGGTGQLGVMTVRGALP